MVAMSRQKLRPPPSRLGGPAVAVPDISRSALPDSPKWTRLSPRLKITDCVRSVPGSAAKSTLPRVRGAAGGPPEPVKACGVYRQYQPSRVASRDQRSRNEGPGSVANCNEWVEVVIEPGAKAAAVEAPSAEKRVNCISFET